MLQGPLVLHEVRRSVVSACNLFLVCGRTASCEACSNLVESYSQLSFDLNVNDLVSASYAMCQACIWAV